MAREFGEPLNEGTQMVIAYAIGAPDDRAIPMWKQIIWSRVYRSVKRLQMRIAKAIREGKCGKAKALQWLLTHSYAAKLLAVKRVTENKGRRTPGVDGEIWNTPQKKVQAVKSLKRHGYRPKPLRRIYIPKKNSARLRPLSIPTMKDRAMQALHSLSLKPVAETMADNNSYGFREKRSCHDAIEQSFAALAKRRSASWILEGDIRACFDEIRHDWLLNNIPMDRELLQKWLKAGYIEKGKLHPTKAGTPQGGIVSPILANMTLDGMEAITSRLSENPWKPL
jgi:RNA-directed DNA polymerase